MSPERQRRNVSSSSLLLLVLILPSFYELYLLTTRPEPDINNYDMPQNSIGRSTWKHNTHTLDEADYIIQRAYDETYAQMADCKDNEVEKDCIKTVIHQFNKRRNQNNTDLALQPMPWWFQTLLRDIPTNKAYGLWSHFSTNFANKLVKFCAIAKNGSTEWRKVFHELNAHEFGGVGKHNYKTKKMLDEDTPKIVFLRDPLERLLSAYLDKCIKNKNEGQCEPNIIFASDFVEQKAIKAGKVQMLQDVKENILFPELAEVAQDSDKEKFATYIDIFPLKWNVHFTPQAISCDLYRNIGQYDIYFMDKSFVSELDHLSTKYKGLSPAILDSVFHYKSLNAEMNSKKGNVGASNDHATKAPTKVEKYYSPRAVRKALEYLSIDYVTLGLSVPEWAREMLKKDRGRL